MSPILLHWEWISRFIFRKSPSSGLAEALLYFETPLRLRLQTLTHWQVWANLRRNFYLKFLTVSGVIR